MRLWSDRFALTSPLLTRLLVLLAGLALHQAASAQAPGPLGSHTVGTKLAAVKGYQKSDDCVIEPRNVDCTFVAPNGVEYSVLGDTVTTVSAREKAVHGDLPLPFGLKFGDSLATVLPRLIARNRRWTLSPPDEEPREGIVIASEDTFPGEGGATFTVELYFDHDRLTRVDYTSEAND